LLKIYYSIKKSLNIKFIPYQLNNTNLDFNYLILI
jgi:hypothetical protein